MVMSARFLWFFLALSVISTASANAQQVGSIRGMVYDKDFNAPLALTQITIAETGAKAVGTEQGNYLFEQVAPGTYTLVFAKDGYTRQVRANVVVNPGQVTEVDVQLAGEITEMEEFVVQDLKLGGATEAGLIALRLESPALLDSIGAELIKLAGASDAAQALNLVAGATIQEGKFAVIRGLPDRYVVTQMNGVRLPSADPDKRAVELDQFPSTIIESIQVSKTFTPDQQGDASGGAVNVVLKGIPDQNILQFSSQIGYNSQRPGKGEFLTYGGGGVDFWGNDKGRRDIKTELLNPITSDGLYGDAVGVSGGDAPIDYKWSLTAGGKLDLEDGVKVGGSVNAYYEQDTNFYDNGISDRWAFNRFGVFGPSIEPITSQGVPLDNPFRTSLYNVTSASEEVKWGGLATFGVELPYNKINTALLRTHAAEDTATEALDTRGKQFFYPGHDPTNSGTPGHDNLEGAPYRRNETLAYNERDTSTIQFRGEHTVPMPDLEVSEYFVIKPPVLDWTYSINSARFYEPDKRQLATYWAPTPDDPNFPGFHLAQTGSSTATGFHQRIWRDIIEDSDQYSINLKFPFTQWTQNPGYVKLGVFNDEVDREYYQDSFTNPDDPISIFPGDFDDRWSAAFSTESHVLSPAGIDVDYIGKQKIFAWYWMVEMPIVEWLTVIGGVRYESTEISTKVSPDGVIDLNGNFVSTVDFFNGTAFQDLIPGVLAPNGADALFEQDDILPALTVIIEPIEKVTIRLAYSETIARQVFKEITPVEQQEYLGGETFIGNPSLQAAALKNYDVRIDYTPFEGGLLSASYFHKDIKLPIEYVQRGVQNTEFIYPINFPEGKLSGVEIEARQNLGVIWEELTGLTVGGNATLIESEVTIPGSELARFASNNFPISPTRQATNAPEFIYNIFATFNSEPTGTELGLFYTVRGEALVAGADFAANGFIPDVYETEYGTLNFTLAQKLGQYVKVRFQAKNLTNPEIQEIYRFSNSDVVRTSYTKGIDFSLGLSAEIPF
jgi:hypothetical protein